MPSEQFDKICRRAEREHLADLCMESLTSYNMQLPWAAVFALALQDMMWWGEHLHRPVVMYLTHIRTRSQVCDDGTV